MNESDRGCVLVGAALVERRLDDIFEHVFQRNKASKAIQKALFDSNGPLSTFSAKIKLAYALGFIRKQTFEDLEAVRRIRNDFAHSADDVDFIGHDASGCIEQMHCVQQFKGKMPRYSPQSEKDLAAVAEHRKVPREVLLRMDGFVKRTKALFALGITVLELELARNLQGATTLRPDNPLAPDEP